MLILKLYLDEIIRKRCRDNGCNFADVIFNINLLYENVCILIQILLRNFSHDTYETLPALFQIMACRRSGDNSVCEVIMSYFAGSWVRNPPAWNGRVNARWHTVQGEFEGFGRLFRHSSPTYCSCMRKLIAFPHTFDSKVDKYFNLAQSYQYESKCRRFPGKLLIETELLIYASIDKVNIG